MALSKIKGTVIADDAINADRIEDGTVVASDILDNTITGGKLATDITISTTGTITTSQVNLGDNDKAQFGASNDLQIYHNGNASYVEDTGTGSLFIRTNGDEVRIDSTGAAQTSARFFPSGAQELYYNNSKKFETTSSGVDVTGTVVSDGLRVDTDTLKVDSSNNVVMVGLTSSLISNNAKLQVAHTDGNADIIVHRAGNNANPPSLNFQKTRNASIGNYGTIVQDNDELGSIRWGGADGSNIAFAARIVGAVDGTPGANDMPGRLQFHTSPDGTENLTERMRIDSSGNVGIGSSTVRGRLTVSDGNTNSAGEAVYQAYIVGTARNFTSDATGMLTIQSTDNMGADKGGSIAFGGRAITGSASGANWAGISGFKENSNSAQYGGYLGFSVRNNVGGGALSEAMRIDSSGNVGIGTNSPSVPLEVQGSSNIVKTYGSTFNNQVHDSVAGGFSQSAYQVGGVTTGLIGANASNMLINTGANASANMIFATGSGTSEAMRIDSSGNVGIGTSSPSSTLSVETSAGTLNVEPLGASAVQLASPTSLGFNIGSGYNYEFDVNGSEVMRINGSTGNVGIGTSSPDCKLHITENTNNSGTTGIANGGLQIENTNATANSWSQIHLKAVGYDAHIRYLNNGLLKFMVDGNTDAMSINDSGNVTIDGSLSKGSGSFRIDHPLPEKTNTHNLVHSFVEAPTADNIYRGKVDLVNGTATVNIDTVAGMSEGTFVLLNREIQCFTSNETGWTAVKGSVSDNILTITAQDEICTDTISWLVIGERQDQHMYDTEWTDENGKVIVEPLK